MGVLVHQEGDDGESQTAARTPARWISGPAASVPSGRRLHDRRSVQFPSDHQSRALLLHGELETERPPLHPLRGPFPFTRTARRWAEDAALEVVSSARADDARRTLSTDPPAQRPTTPPRSPTSRRLRLALRPAAHRPRPIRERAQRPTRHGPTTCTLRRSDSRDTRTAASPTHQRTSQPRCDRSCSTPSCQRARPGRTVTAARREADADELQPAPDSGVVPARPRAQGRRTHPLS